MKTNKDGENGNGLQRDKLRDSFWNFAKHLLKRQHLHTNSQLPRMSTRNHAMVMMWNKADYGSSSNDSFP